MKLPVKCPSCSAQLEVKTLLCNMCGTQVDGHYALPSLAMLDVEVQQFIVSFVKNSGSLKEMSKELGLSYPTVRNRLDEIINLLKSFEE